MARFVSAFFFSYTQFNLKVTVYNKTKEKLD